MEPNVVAKTLRFLLFLPPEISLFLAVALGHLLGKLKVGPVQLGGVCGALIAALILGQSGVQIDAGLKNFCFAIFIFALGYAGGPQFFANLNAKGLRLGVLSVIELVMVLVLALMYMRVMGFDPGTTAGLVAGAATESAVIGTASEAIAHLPLPAERIALLQANVVTAYSITYVFGLIGIVVFTSQIGPILLRVNLRQAAEALWERLSGGAVEAAPGSEEATPIMVGRLYSVTVGAGKTVAAVAASLGGATRVERVRRRGKLLEVTPDLVLEEDDSVLIMGRRAGAVRAGAVLGVEKSEAGGLNLAVTRGEFVAQRADIIGKSLRELNALAREMNLGAEVYLSGLTRGTHAMPLVPDLVLQRGDVAQLYGTAEGVNRMGPRIGKRVSRSDKSNFVYMGAGLVLGILVGRIAVPVAGINISLGTGGGALLMGLIFGWFQSGHRAIDGIPASSLELMKDLGLSAFVACVGLSSGPQAVALMGQYGIVLPLVGLSISLIPALLSLIVGRFLLRIDVPVLLGGIAGQQCSTPALSAVQGVAGNTTPLMGYTITYAISNALLPMLGPLIVGLAGLAAAS